MVLHSKRARQDESKATHLQQQIEDQNAGEIKLSQVAKTVLNELKALVKDCAKRHHENLTRQDKVSNQVAKLTGHQDSNLPPLGYKVSHALVLPKDAPQEHKDAL